MRYKYVYTLICTYASSLNMVSDFKILCRSETHLKFPLNLFTNNNKSLSDNLYVCNGCVSKMFRNKPIQIKLIDHRKIYEDVPLYIYA